MRAAVRTSFEKKEIERAIPSDLQRHGEKSKQISVERAIRERLSPKPGDPLYLHLADLLLVMKKAATSEAVTLLDYGAGLSPYRSLFPHSQYRTADVASSKTFCDELIGTPARHQAFATPDYVISSSGAISEESNTFDYVLSTQVLEHVPNPETYLLECFRLLKPGGKLFLTTHGSYEDHASPYDYHRWTADGLKYDLQKTGFRILSIDKLTTGPRAMIWFFQLYCETMGTSRKTLLGLCQWLCRTVPRRWFHIQADRLYSKHRVVSAEARGHHIYLSLAALAQRPSGVGQS
jgi:SAM-dependent methyltransferase